VTTLNIGYARVSTDDQDLTAQRDALAALGSRRSGATSTTASPAQTETGPGCAKQWPPADPATSWS
jgi:hypothetical protein